MGIVNIKEFCKRTGFPVAMLRAYCREGRLSHWRRGRVYLVDIDEAVGELKNLKETKVHKRQVIKKPVVERRRVAAGDFDFHEEIAKRQRECKGQQE